MTIRVSSLKGRTIAGEQGLFARIRHECQLALYHPNKLVLVTVPVSLTGSAARRDYRQIDAKEAQPLRPRRAADHAHRMSDARPTAQDYALLRRSQARLVLRSGGRSKISSLLSVAVPVVKFSHCWPLH